MNIKISPHCAATVVILCGGLSFAQTKVDLRSQSKSVDFGNSSFTRPVRVGTALAPTCTTGELFFRSDAAPGSNLYGCVATNTWSMLAGAGTSITPGSVNTFMTSDGSSTVWRQFSAGPSGAVSMSFTPGAATVDVDTTVVPRKTTSETISGLWTFSQGLLAPPIAAPASPVEGQLYIDSATNLLKWYAGGAVRSAGGGGDTVGSSGTAAGQMPVFADTTGKLLGKYTGSGVLKAASGVISEVTGTATDCVRVNGSSGACATGDTYGSSATTSGQLTTFADTTGKLLGQFTGTGVLTASSGVVGTVSGAATDCVKVDGSSGACGGTSITPGSANTFMTSDGSSTVWRQFSAGPSGAVSMSFTPGAATVDVDTTVVPRKTTSETISGLWTFSNGLLAPPIAAPASPVEGQLYIDSATSLLKWYAGGTLHSASGGDTVGSSGTTAGQMPIFADTTGKLLDKYTGSGVLKASSGVISEVTGTATDCVRVNGSSGACATGDTYGSSATTSGQLTTFADTTGKQLDKFIGSGVLKASAGVASTVSGAASDCVRVDGTSGACGGAAGPFTPQAPILFNLYSMSGVGWATGTANIVSGVMVTVPYAFTLGRIGAAVQTAGAAGANIYLGVYSTDGTTKYCDVVLSAATTGGKSAACPSPVSMSAGAYYLAWASSDSGVKFYGQTATTMVEDTSNAGTSAMFFIASANASGGAMPATLGTISKSSIVSPIYFSILAN